MKHALKAAVPAICMIAGSAAHAQHSYSLTGELAKDKQGQVRISYSNGNTDVKDSAQVTNGVFVLKGKVGDPVKAFITYHPTKAGGPSGAFSMNADYKEVYLEEGTITLKSTAGLKEATVKGGKTQADYTAWSAQHKVFDDQLSQIGARAMEYKMAMNDTAMQSIVRRSKPLVAQKNQVDSNFVKTHPDSYLSFVILFKRSDGIIDPETIEPAFNRLSANVRNSIAGKKLAARIAKAKTLSPGQPAIDFTLKDTTGNSLSIAAAKGKYLLLFFYSVTNYSIESNLVSVNRVQQRLAGNDLSVVGVSFDSDIRRWKKTLADNDVRFTNVLDSNGIDKMGNGTSALTKAYDLNFYSVPQCILIGPDGNIVARALAPDNELSGKIEKLTHQKPAAIAHAAAGGTEPLDVFVGGEIAEYPKVEWIKGEPITHFDKDKIYIVELWATWCGPCVAAMPHLNELHKKFKDKGVVFVAQGVWEEDKKKLVDFVKQKGEGLSYRVAFSGTKGSDFDKRWVVPAAIVGIPATFVIQDGKLVWQTMPDQLNETIIQMLIDKKFTIEAAKAMAATH